MMTTQNVIKIRFNKARLIFGFTATVVSFAVFSSIFLYAIRFTSIYDVLGVVGGGMGALFSLYMFIHVSPGLFSKGRVIYTIIPGPDGRIESLKKSVDINNIRDYKIAKTGFTPRAMFFEDLIIYTLDNKKVKMPTYNLLHYQDLNDDLKKYLLPYINTDSQARSKAKSANHTGITEKIK